MLGARVTRLLNYYFFILYSTCYLSLVEFELIYGVPLVSPMPALLYLGAPNWNGISFYLAGPIPPCRGPKPFLTLDALLQWNLSCVIQASHLALIPCSNLHPKSLRLTCKLEATRGMCVFDFVLMLSDVVRLSSPFFHVSVSGPRFICILMGKLILKMLSSASSQSKA